MTVDTDYAWAAGFIDGEGYIGCNYYDRLRLEITAAQNSLKPLEKLKYLFGGNICVCGTTSTGNIAHKWSLTGAKKIYEALDKIIPYMIEKQDQALIQQKLCFMVLNKTTKRTRPLDKQEVKNRKILIDRLKELRA